MFTNVLTFILTSVNVLEGPPEDRNMLTGLHTVCDISCVSCETILGWKYVSNF